MLWLMTALPAPTGGRLPELARAGAIVNRPRIGDGTSEENGMRAYHETGLVEFQNPDFPAMRACGADGYRVDTLEQFEDAFGLRSALGRPSVIDVKITRWAVPR